MPTHQRLQAVAVAKRLPADQTHSIHRLLMVVAVVIACALNVNVSDRIVVMMLDVIIKAEVDRSQVLVNLLVQV